MNSDSVHIVGGGIIGLCAAWFLTQEGCQVSIIDEHDITDGTSFGNAGMIVPSHFIPMAQPGVISKGLKWMLHSKSPFYIKPRFNADLVQWLWQFYKHSNKAHVSRSIPVLFEMNERSKLLYSGLARLDGFDFNFEEQGLLMLFNDQKYGDAEAQVAELAYKNGIQAEKLDRDGLEELDPNVDYKAKGGIYYPGDAHLHPNRLMSQLVQQLKKKGVTFLTGKRVTGFKYSGSKIEGLMLDDRENIPIKNLLLSAGSWTAKLLAKLGIKLLLQDGKGYSMTLDRKQGQPNIPTILTEAKVALTPMGNSFRIAGTLELSGLSDTINRTKVKGILESLPKYYGNIDVPNINDQKIWKGYRPCSPDGMPYLGRSNQFNNLFVGTGHGMMGLSLGAISGKLISELMTENQTSMDIKPFDLHRF